MPQYQQQLIDNSEFQTTSTQQYVHTLLSSFMNTIIAVGRARAAADNTSKLKFPTVGHDDILMHEWRPQFNIDLSSWVQPNTSIIEWLGWTPDDTSMSK